MKLDKPSDETAAKIRRQSILMTTVATSVCIVLWFLIGKLDHWEPIRHASHFTQFFQILLVASWCFLVWPYLRFTLLTMLYGVDLSERTSKVFNEPENSPMVAYIRKVFSEEGAKLDARYQAEKEELNKLLLDFKAEAGNIRTEISGLAGAFKKPVTDPMGSTKMVMPTIPRVETHVPDAGGKQR